MMANDAWGRRTVLWKSNPECASKYEAPLNKDRTTLNSLLAYHLRCLREDATDPDLTRRWRLVDHSRQPLFWLPPCYGPRACNFAL
jgi:hypothetical protein